MRWNAENKNKNPVNIRFVAKTSDIRNLSENITSDVMWKYEKWQFPELLVKYGGSRCQAKFLTSEISDFTPCAHAQSKILHIKYPEKIDD